MLKDLAIVSNFAPTAQIACKQGKYLAKRLNAKLEGTELNLLNTMIKVVFVQSEKTMQ